MTFQRELKLKVFQRGFNYSQDGRGNRLVIHLQGCNLRCPWCSNPEGFEYDGVLLENRRLSCEEWETDKLLKLCSESVALFFDGGGVTFTGGEPTMQHESLMFILKALQEKGIHTAVETNGTSPKLPEFFPFIDQLIMDFKTPFPKKHDRFLGPGGETLINNIRSALKTHKGLLIRIPLIHGFNTSDADLEAFLSVIGESAAGVFEFLSYHEFGAVKWKQCGLEYRQKEAYVPAETVRCFKDRFLSRDLQVIHT